VRNAKRTPVLLLSGTTVDPDENFAWNWMPALSDAGIPWCAQTAPDRVNMEDIQTRGEYIVFAIRRMHRLAGRRIAIYGHSQGGMVGRWALRFWPDTRETVSDVVGAAPSNHGTDLAVGACLPNCAEAIWQQRTGSDFVQALNSRRQTFPGVDYTNIYSHTDTVVFPNLDDTGHSSLQGPAGRIENVAIQDICPLALSEHLAVGTFDPIAWALFNDALENAGPARAGRIDPGVCSQLLMPGVNPATFATDLAAAGTALATTLATFPHVDSEPPLRRYVFAR
jgi:pimeloyl-ACP methyl ester carboxylesterase